jgi:hypothetical protein
MKTQAAQLVQAIRRSRTRGMTYGELADVRWPSGARVSACAHKRLAEAAHRYLKAHEVLTRITRRDGLIAFRIVRRVCA